MPQALYMVLVEASDPSKVSESGIKQWVADQYGGHEVHIAVSKVIDAHVRDYDEELNELEDELSDLQAEIQKQRGDAGEEDFDPEDPMGIWSGVAESECLEDDEN